jgi:hypothetical protein
MSLLSHPRRFVASLRGGFGVAALLIAATLFAADEEPRFSSTLTGTQRTEAGFAQLSDDNIAVIDALVRQDEAALRRQSQALRPGNFSQRRTAHETEIAGLARLSAEQRGKLDEFVARRSSAAIPELTAEVGRAPSVRPVVEQAARPALEVHGSVSLTYGWSKGGNTKGGEMVVSVQDPARRFALTVSYAEYRGKGTMSYYDPADDLYRYRPTPTLPVVEP